jgi:hypothetical protein
MWIDNMSNTIINNQGQDNMEEHKSFISRFDKFRNEISGFVDKLKKQSNLKLDLLLLVAIISLVILLLH